MAELAGGKKVLNTVVFNPNWRLASKVIYNVQKSKVNPGHCHHSKTTLWRDEVCNWIWVCRQLSHRRDAIVYPDGHLSS